MYFITLYSIDIHNIRCLEQFFHSMTGVIFGGFWDWTGSISWNLVITFICVGWKYNDIQCVPTHLTIVWRLFDLKYIYLGSIISPSTGLTHNFSPLFDADSTVTAGAASAYFSCNPLPKSDVSIIALLLIFDNTKHLRTLSLVSCVFVPMEVGDCPEKDNKRTNRDPCWVGIGNLTLLLIEQGAEPRSNNRLKLCSTLEPGRTHFTCS